jgi:hypothetical protein
MFHYSKDEGKLTMRSLGLALVILASILAGWERHGDQRASSVITGQAGSATLEAYGKLPLSFEANRGQADDQIKFLSRGSGYSLFLTATEAIFRMRMRNAECGMRNADRGSRIEDREDPFSIFDLRSSILNFHSSILDLHSPIRNPQSAILNRLCCG